MKERKVAIILGIVVLAAFLLALTLPGGFLWRKVAHVGPGGHGLDLQGDRLYIAADSSVWVLDVSHPSEPKLTARGLWLDDHPADSYVRVVGPYLYRVVRWGMLSIADAEPVGTGIWERGVFHSGGSVNLEDFEVWENTAVLVGALETGLPNTGIVIGVNVTDPDAPTEAFRVELPESVLDVAIEGDQVYLTSAGGELLIWRLTGVGVENITSLRIREADSSGGRVLTGIDVSGGRAYVGGADAGLFVVTLSPTPTVTGRIPTAPWEVLRVRAVGDDVLVSQEPVNWSYSPGRMVTQFSPDSSGALRPAATLYSDDRGAAVDADSDGRTVYSLGDYDLEIFEYAPATIWDVYEAARVGPLVAGCAYAVAIAVVESVRYRRRDSVGGQKANSDG